VKEWATGRNPWPTPRRYNTMPQPLSQEATDLIAAQYPASAHGEAANILLGCQRAPVERVRLMLLSLARGSITELRLLAQATDGYGRDWTMESVPPAGAD